MNISLGEHGSAIIVKVEEKIERYSLAEHPDSGSLAVEDEIQAVQHEIDLPSSSSLLKNAGQLLFLAYSAGREARMSRRCMTCWRPFPVDGGKKPHVRGKPVF
ncbi:MAG: hypothetical protein LBM00_04925 [Deltaproteobacteria bacterium]|nr:hypothetical protein [Deltaproteobacteria bacterium]